ncbi:MAG: tetratricopeptide repeat protein [Myxococcota bacterium]
MIILMMCLLMPQAKSEGALPTETRSDAETSVRANSINATNEHTDDMHLTEAQYFDALSVLELEEMVQLRKRSGQYDDALRHLTILIKRVDDLDYHYEEALLYELKEDYAQAAQRYEAILTAPELSPVFRRNIQFRYGIVLSDMGLDRDALAVFRTVSRAKDLKSHEKLILEYARGVAYIYAGKTRKGIRKINKTLLKQNSDTGSWIEARARAALVYVLIEESERLTFEKPKKTAQRFQKRSELVGAAEEQIVVMINLGEPEYVLRSLVLLSEAYFQVAEEMRVAPPPPTLNREQQIRFQKKQLERADFIDERGRSYCAKGVGYSDQMGFKGQARLELEVCANEE